MKINAVDPYAHIRSYSLTYVQAMRKLGQGIGTSDPEEETLAVIMVRSGIEDMLRRYEFDIAAVIGVEGGKVTISLVGLDAQGQVIKDDGQEVWVDKFMVSQIDEFLPAI
jgi:hypothetical protein